MLQSCLVESRNTPLPGAPLLHVSDPKGEQMSRRFTILATAVVVAFIATSSYSAAKAQTPPQLIISTTPGPDTSTALRGYVDFYIKVVSSAATLPVQDVSVAMSRCQFGQQTPFKLVARTRHLVPGQEALKAFDGGNWMEWQLQSVPAPKLLHVQMALPLNKGGPLFCVEIAGLIHEQLVTPAIQLQWWLK